MAPVDGKEALVETKESDKQPGKKYLAPFESTIGCWGMINLMKGMCWARTTGKFSMPEGPGLTKGMSVPDELKLLTLDGVEKSMSSLCNGKRPVMLNFGSCS